MRAAKRVIIVAIDNLRADRLWNPSKKRAIPIISHLAESGLLGIAMGGGPSPLPFVTSILTASPPHTHGVFDDTSALPPKLTPISEPASASGWHTYFYSASALATRSRGFARGFGEAHSEPSNTDSRALAASVASSIAGSPEHSLYFVHLSELRLPHRDPLGKMMQWGLPAYAGPVSMQSMMNAVVMRNPSADDARQFEAYYDSELAVIDEAVGKLVGALPDNTLLLLTGTHGSSLEGPYLGYGQGLTPQELLVPYIAYMPGKRWSSTRTDIAAAEDLAATVLAAMGMDNAAGGRPVTSRFDSRPYAQGDGVSATSALSLFYRIRREGVDVLYTTGLGSTPGVPSQTDGPHPISSQALREKID